MPEVVAEVQEGLCLDPGPPLLPPCCVQTLRCDFFGVSSHYSFPPSRVRMDIKLTQEIAILLVKNSCILTVFL